WRRTGVRVDRCRRDRWHQSLRREGFTGRCLRCGVAHRTIRQCHRHAARQRLLPGPDARPHRAGGCRGVQTPDEEMTTVQSRPIITAGSQRTRVRAVDWLSRYAAATTLAVLLAVAAIATPDFYHSGNIRTIVLQASALGVVVLGQSVALLV